jgi:hypothetical protein
MKGKRKTVELKKNVPCQALLTPRSIKINLKKSKRSQEHFHRHNGIFRAGNFRSKYYKTHF